MNVNIPYQSGIRLMLATESSQFKQIATYKYARGKDGQVLKQILTSVRYSIDGNEISQETFKNVIKKIEVMIFIKTKKKCVWETLNGSDGITLLRIKEPESLFYDNILDREYETKWTKTNPVLKGKPINMILTGNDKPIKVVFEGEPMTEKELSKKLRERLADKDFQTIAGKQSLFNIVESIIDDNLEEWKVADPMIPQSVIEESLNKLWGKRAECCIYDDYMYMGNSAYEHLKKILNSIEKENEDMPKIVNYKYNEEKGLTEITWSDKTITRVVAGDDTEKSAYVGFVSACAKKLFGNKSTYLNQFDKWTVKIPERERLAAEKKAAEDKEREEAKARKAAKKAERRAKREVELLAKEFADNYKHESVWEQAKKLAVKKYGVPAGYFDDSCDCHCNCKEFDAMSEDSENNISD